MKLQQSTEPLKFASDKQSILLAGKEKVIELRKENEVIHSL